MYNSRVNFRYAKIGPPSPIRKKNHEHFAHDDNETDANDDVEDDDDEIDVDGDDLTDNYGVNGEKTMTTISTTPMHVTSKSPTNQVHHIHPINRRSIIFPFFFFSHLENCTTQPTPPKGGSKMIQTS